MHYIDWQNLVKLAGVVGVVGTGYDMVDVGIHYVVVEVSMVSCLLHLCMSLVGFRWLEWRLIRIGVDSRGSLIGDGLLLVWVCLGTLSDVDRDPVGYP